MKAIVTGGLGFIGSNLVDILIEQGHEIVIVDDKSNNVVDETFYAGKCKVIISKVGNLFDRLIYDFMETDIVFHLASFVGPSGILPHCGNMGRMIVDDTYLLTSFCINNKALLVDISTSEVYGHKNVLHEDSEKVFPGEYKVRTEYGAAKMLGEITIVNRARVNKNLKYHIIRPFNVAGKRQKPDGGFVLPRFVIAALTGQSITVFGDGKQERAFTNVRDICTAIIKIAFSDRRNEIWNIGNPNNRITIERLAKRVGSLISSLSHIIYVDPKKIYGDLFAEAVDKIPCIEKIEELVGWSPLLSINDTILEVKKYYEDKIKEGYMFKVI